MPGLEHFQFRRLIFKRRRRTMNRIALLCLNRSESIDGLSQHVHHAAQGCTSHGNGDRSAEIDALHAAHHALGRRHGYRAHAAFAQVLRNLGDDIDRLRPLKPFAGNMHRVMNFRQMMLGKLHVDHRPNDLNYVPDVPCFMLRHLWLLAVANRS